MRKIAVVIVMSGLTIMACNTSNNNTATEKMNHSSAHTDGYVSPFTSPVNGILHIYLHLKNALVNDDDKAAAGAANEMVKVLNDFDKSVLRDDERKQFEDMADDMKENAEHIGANAGNINNQRKYFNGLSNDMYGLVKTFAAGERIYVFFCPVHNDNRGAMWLSETKEIKNPFSGKEMDTCGSIKEELK